MTEKIENGRSGGGKCLLILLPLALLLAVMFSSVIFASRSFGYRDAVHFYYPLYQELAEALGSGRIPYWDPALNLGQPMIANPVCAFFYPGKLIFLAMLIPSVSYAHCLKWYILAHYMVAYLTFYRFARRFASRGASVFGALAYTFGGAVLFQYNNVIYLVGAAWFPAIIGSGMALIDHPRIGAAVRACLPMVLVFLGGEPEALYLAMVALAGYCLLRWRGEILGREGGSDAGSPVPAARRGKTKDRTAPVPEAPLKKTGGGTTGSTLLKPVLYLGFSVVLAVLLSMVQFLPTWEMSRLSNRSGQTEPMTVWELARAPQEVRSHLWSSALLCDGVENPSTRVGTTYHFSVPPWEMLTFFWPNIGGKSSRYNASWAQAWDFKMDNWIPSLYFGIFAFLAAASALRFRRRAGELPRESTRRIFFSWGAILLILGSLGAFGPLWLAELLTGSTSETVQSGDPVGGVYWLMTQLLPGFVSFRFPAKLMSEAAFFLCALSVIGYDGFKSTAAARRGFTFARRGLLFLSVLIALLFFSPAGKWLWMNYVRLPQPTEAAYYSLFGPFNIDAAARCCAWSALSAAVFLSLFEIYQRKRRRAGGGLLLSSRAFDTAAVALLALDLFLANRWQVVSIPDRSLSQPTAISSVKGSRGEPPVRFFRVLGAYPMRTFGASASEHRLEETALWQRGTLSGLFPGRDRFANIDNESSMRSGPYDEFLCMFSQHQQPWYDVLSFLDCRLFLFPDGGALSPSGASLVSSSPVEGTLPWPIEAALWEARVRDGRLRIFHQEFEGLPPALELQQRHRCPTPEGESARFVDYQNEKLTIRAELADPGYLTVCEQYWPGWRCRVTPMVGDRPDRSQTHEVEIRPCCGFLRRVDLPAGSWEIEMTYRPTLLYAGGIVSILTAAAVLVLALISRSINCFTKHPSGVE